MPMREAAIPTIISRASVPAASNEALRPLLSDPHCGPAERAELRSIGGENDPELLQASLRNFAARQESKGRLVYAATAYELALSRGEDPQARGRLNVLRGGGNFGERAELLLGDFIRQATSVEMLGGMAAGSLVGQSLQAITLARLLSREGAYFTRGLGARGLAAGLGFLGEAPAVVFASKGLHQAGGGSVDWGAKTLGHEMLGMGLSLGLLKSGSALSGRVGEGLAQGSAAHRLSASILPHASAVTALFAAHRLESWIGLRPPSDAPSALFESLAMLLQFQIGGRLLHSATGGALSRGLSELRVRSRISEGPSFPEGPQAFSTLNFAGAMAHRRRPSPFLAPLPGLESAKNLQGEVNQMSSFGEQGGGQAFVYRRLLQRLSGALAVPESDPRLKAIADNYWATPFYHQAANSRGAYFDMLAKTELVGSNFLEGREIPAVDLMQNASLILRRAMEMNPFRGGSGSFYDFLTQVAFEQTLQSRKVPAFDALVHTLSTEPRQSALENFFNRYELDFPFTRQELGSGSASMSHSPWLRRLEAYPVSEEVRWWLAEYLLSYNHGLFAKSFRDPAYNYFHPADANPRPRPMGERNVFDSLDDIFADPVHREVWRRGLQQLARRAEKSPVPLLYFDRFFKLLGSGDIQEKISELVLGTEYNPLEVWQMQQLGMSIEGTVYTGYVSDPVLTEKFHNFYRALPELIHPAHSQDRLAEYRLKAKLLLNDRENYEREEILELLYHRPTQRAAEARQAILNGEVGLEILTRAGMESLMRQLRPGKSIAKLHDALYLPASRSPTGLPYIAILQLDPKLSREEKIARAPYLAAYAVHEYDHHRHAGELDFNQRSQRLKAEMRAWLEENLYLLTQGEKTVWDEAEIVSPNGFGVYLRSLIERQYLHEEGDYLQKQP